MRSSRGSPAARWHCWPGDVLDHLGACLADDFDMDHSTFQLETSEHVRWEANAAMSQQ
ncbi:MAG TPA: hypothetical protein VL749_10730 [Patescibacteria group bacterium]|nr:hypothetical protein [Patescibacteria group bacterium]